MGWRNVLAVRALVTLVGDPDSIPRIHMVIHSHAELQLFGIPWVPGYAYNAHTYMQAKYSKRKKKSSKFSFTF